MVGRLREQARSHRVCITNCGSGLAREGARPDNTHHLGCFDIRNDFALASTTKYITNVISNGNKK